MQGKTTVYEGWAILELIGHRRLAGEVSEVTMYGSSMLRIDVPSLCNLDGPAHDCPICGKCLCAISTQEIDRSTCPVHGGNPNHGPWRLTQFYNASAIYCLTPCTEAEARRLAAESNPSRPRLFEHPTAQAIERGNPNFDDDEDEYPDPPSF